MNARTIMANDKMYVVRRVIATNRIDKVLLNATKEDLCMFFGCDTMLNGSDGHTYFVDFVEDAIIVD